LAAVDDSTIAKKGVEGVVGLGFGAVANIKGTYTTRARWEDRRKMSFHLSCPCSFWRTLFYILIESPTNLTSIFLCGK
jgi:hypothetical protein